MDELQGVKILYDVATEAKWKSDLLENGLTDDQWKVMVVDDH